MEIDFIRKLGKLGFKFHSVGRESYEKMKNIRKPVTSSGPLEAAGIPVVFSGAESGFTLTGATGQASMAIVPHPPETYDHVAAYLATAPETAINFTIYTKYQPPEGMGMKSMPAGSEIIFLEIGGKGPTI